MSDPFETFSPAPKPGREGSKGPRRDKRVAEAARQRDGGCLYGLMNPGSGCVAGYDPHHITSFGSMRSEADYLENIICLCRKHHQWAENAVIPKIELRGILHHFYGYGLSPEYDLIITNLRELFAPYGIQIRFYFHKKNVQIDLFSLFWRETLWMDYMLFEFDFLADAIGDRVYRHAQ